MYLINDITDHWQHHHRALTITPSTHGSSEYFFPGLFGMLKQTAKFRPKGTNIFSFSLINQDSCDLSNQIILSVRLKWLLVQGIRGHRKATETIFHVCLPIYPHFIRYEITPISSMSHNLSSGSCMSHDPSPASCMAHGLSSSSWTRTYLVWLTSPSCSTKERSMSSRPNWTWNPNWLLPVTFTWEQSNNVNLFTHWSFQSRVYLPYFPLLCCWRWMSGQCLLNAGQLFWERSID